ncbi:uncharacterized protein Bfra_010048 [Botrytis fragariae]|uniref:Uncharacterized protein n=1 Tax=Botrytis fragariae TaxID=1964551 RepID=A0A8H6ALG4_9HELO|nr:uncharacterized protein Bfra_010048 [Botrytis fragariae]KAF5869903.1 hypothetical protein Bfra_010048 [Botrytis fragariae]
MNVLLRKKKDRKSATPSTTSSVNPSTHVTSTNASSSTQVASIASLEGGSDSESKKHRSHKGHNVSTKSSSTVVDSSSNSAREGKNTGSVNRSHQESNHGPGTSSSQASVRNTRPELKTASKSLLSNIPLSRTKINAEEKERDKKLEQEHRKLGMKKHGTYTYVEAYQAAELEESRYRREKEYLNILENDPLATEEEIREQKKEVKSKREIRNKANETFDKVHKDDKEIADEQLKVLSKMGEDNSYRIKAEKRIKKEEEKTRKEKIKEDKEEKRAKEAAIKAEEDEKLAKQERIASEKKKEEEDAQNRAERTKYKDNKFERSQYGNSRKKGERERERERMEK